MANKGRFIAAYVMEREGKNTYTQGVNRTKVDAGSSDCSSLMQWAFRKGAGVDIGSNTTAQMRSDKLETVDLLIERGVPDESKMQVGDLLYFRGADTGRKSTQYVGHVEIYVGNGQISGHGSGIGPTRKNMAAYCQSRQRMASPVPAGNRGLICVRRLKGSAETTTGRAFFATCSGNGVNLRKGRGASYASLGKLDKGDKILALPAVNGWCEAAVAVGDKLAVGYMSSQYVKAIN